VRRLWRDYYLSADAIVFLIDASNRERFDEAKHELYVRTDTYTDRETVIALH